MNTNVYGIDKNKDSIQMLKHLIKSIHKEYPLDRFVNGNLEEIPYKQHDFDAIVSSAVLHFAESKEHFLHMFSELHRILKPEGILFIRMATDLGMEGQIKSMGNGKFLLPDNSVRFLLTKQLLNEIVDKFGYSFEENFKSVVVDGKRSMGTLVLKKQ
jgi:tellurite methyltransferase